MAGRVRWVISDNEKGTEVNKGTLNHATVNNWEEAGAMTVQQLMAVSTSSITRGGGRLTATTKAINSYIIWAKANDKYGQAHPVLNYRNRNSAMSMSQRLRRAGDVAKLVREGKPLDSIAKSYHTMRFIDLVEGEKLFAAVVQNKNGSHDVWIALLIDGVHDL